MEKSFCFLTRRQCIKGLTEAQVLRKAEVFKECEIPFEVYLEVKKVKVEYVKVNI